MGKEIDGLKSGASSMLTQFGKNLTSLRESTANILKEAGEQISKSFDKTETHVEKIGEEVKKIKSESDKEDATHSTQIEGHDKRLDRLETRQDKLMGNPGGSNA